MIICSTGALKRAEWVKFLAPFFNKESIANLYYAGVEAAYNVTKVSAWPLHKQLY